MKLEKMSKDKQNQKARKQRKIHNFKDFLVYQKITTTTLRKTLNLNQKTHLIEP